MKKVGIVTIESNNFGNRLQNYAMQTVLESLGFQAETFRRGEKPTAKDEIKSAIKLCGHKFFRTKPAKFSAFNKNINRSKIYIDTGDVPEKLCENYDFFVSGSDQVWNPHYSFTGTDADMLKFANPEQRVSYAASFGVESIPEEKKETYKQGLSGFKALSVRETAGAKIIEELIGRRAEPVLDPTLMIDAVQWRKAANKPDDFPNEKYIFICALGKKNEAFKNAVEFYGKEYKVYEALALNKRGKERAIGPAEFLYLIDHAEMILTDSFHTTVFSILFRKKVETFNRPGINMNSRIVTLSEVTGLSRCMKNGIFSVEDEDEYETVGSVLEAEREKSLAFLKKALDIEQI